MTSFAGKEKERVWKAYSRREVEGMIAEGRSIIILDGFVLKVDAWLKYHPGGPKAIFHMVGRDATDEVTVLHSPEARAMMDRYRIGRVEGRWVNFLPPIQGGVFRPLGEEEEDVADTPPPSSHASSRSPSPPAVFDEGEGLRNRKVKGAPSVSSVEEDETEKPFDGMAHLDMLTKKEIKLDLERYPPLDGATQDEIMHKYRLLNQRIRDEGLFQCNYRAYGIECCRYTLIFIAMLFFLRIGWYATSGFFLGAFWHQLVFTAHDAGHMGITHDFHTDSVIGIIIANFLGGLSLGWWKHNHNVHHIVTNSPEHDPDIEHMPFFAISHRFLASLRSTYYERVMTYDRAAQALISVQNYTYYILLLFGRFNLYRLSWAFLIFGKGPRRGPAWWHRHLEIAGTIFFWSWFGYALVYRSIPTNAQRIIFVLVSHMVTAPLHVQITLSHFAMSTADLGTTESFPQKMLRTTMDVDCPEWLDFFHGGLQFQAIHHLYPRIPRHNLRRTQKLVMGFCEEVGIPYALYGFADGNRVVIGRLGEVARQAAILKKCQAAAAREGIH
ncbi:fatty acid desaturase-domain-containing protein [Immersiella caudata]|uniref:Delta 8-(E)-sphingolipid desaturase n=1 Tax=Immersiella caudata TaxID=314043 RepID=A0AA39WBX7_9PEZI|nr:fatty acid desaturase-domain-containing protein [Immersiella caudata]